MLPQPRRRETVGKYTRVTGQGGSAFNTIRRISTGAMARSHYYTQHQTPSNRIETRKYTNHSSSRHTTYAPRDPTAQTRTRQQPRHDNPAPAPDTSRPQNPVPNNPSPPRHPNMPNLSVSMENLSQYNVLLPGYDTINEGNDTGLPRSSASNSSDYQEPSGPDSDYIPDPDDNDSDADL